MQDDWYDAIKMIKTADLNGKIVATYCGIMWHLYPNGGIPKQFVAVDGSVYEKMPTIKDNMQKAIYEILGEEADKLELVLENGGSALGAALAAAMEPVEC